MRLITVDADSLKFAHNYGSTDIFSISATARTETSVHIFVMLMYTGILAYTHTQCIYGECTYTAS